MPGKFFEQAEEEGEAIETEEQTLVASVELIRSVCPFCVLRDHGF